ncbi:hypothetical protein GOC74_06005 [Halomicrobium mukohataei]|uniref:Uncharacterized protein n=1 Tax=Halomicrobium mukohataei TaxID=57705 RepID=A0A847U905_9EURY|nr:hypothetical protein [Halomicrobium mukohataei]NLV09479.1 hypothetical protein [Halomicrobium mukohataei]
MAEFARLAGAPDRLANLVGETTLTPDATDPYYERVLFALREDALTAPARSGSPAVYTSYRPDHFDSYAVDRPSYVVLGAVPTLQWLDWLDDDRVEVVFGGDPGRQLIEWAEIRGRDHRMRAEPLPTDVAVESVDLGMPAAFDDDGRFAPDGAPAPTRVETDAATLERLVTAAEIVDSEGVPVVVEDGQFRLAVSGEVVAGTGTLSARTVEGPDCRNWYGPELGALTRTLDGPIRLEIVPDGPMAVVQETETATRRYVLDERV